MWGITITTMHSNTNIPIGKCFILISHIFSAFEFILWSKWRFCLCVVLGTRHQIFPIFLLSQYTQCDIFFFLGTQYIAQKIPISMQNATIWMGTFWEINDVFFYTGIKVLSTCLCQKGLPFNIARIVRMLLFSVTLYCQVTLIVVNVNNCWTLWMWMWNVLIGSNFIRTSTDKRNIMATNRIIQSQIGKDKWKQKSSGVENEIKSFKRICKLDWRGSHYHMSQSQLVWSFESQGVSKILRACRNFGKVNG